MHSSGKKGQYVIKCVIQCLKALLKSNLLSAPFLFQSLFYWTFYLQWMNLNSNYQGDYVSARYLSGFSPIMVLIFPNNWAWEFDSSRSLLGGNVPTALTLACARLRSLARPSRWFESSTSGRFKAHHVNGGKSLNMSSDRMLCVPEDLHVTAANEQKKPPARF